ncbi:NUDIX domain-containing protein [Amycolatopsis japonica]|uniref:NUDIX domain-containing protein n=1 Tax=Amycolatopsis japonica TaxID=208439 RepID=UPI00366FDA2F
MSGKFGPKSAEMVLFTEREGVLLVLLVERSSGPLQGKPGFPGGSVNPGEDAEVAARRVCRVETGLAAPSEMSSTGVYDDEYRDPGGDHVTVAFNGIVPDAPDPVAAGDAQNAAWRPVSEILDGDQVAPVYRRIVLSAVSHQLGNIAAQLNARC